MLYRYTKTAAASNSAPTGSAMPHDCCTFPTILVSISLMFLHCTLAQTFLSYC